MSKSEWITKLLLPTPTEPPNPVRPGLYHYMRSAGEDVYSAGAYTRFHLRVETDGRGLLIANASAALHLSPSGVVIAKGLLDDATQEEIITQLKTSFRGAPQETMVSDLERVAATIVALVAPGDNYPVMNLEDADISPYDAELMAPFQADVDLSSPSIMPRILDRLWEANIPHVTFMVTASFDSDLLLRAVERAEDLGMIAGIRGRASDLSDPSFMPELAMTGLDHCNLLFASADAAVHDNLCGSGDHEQTLPLFEAVLANEVAPVAEVPLSESTVDGLRTTLDLLLDNGVNNVNVLAIAADNDVPAEQRAGSLLASAMPQTADIVEEIAAESDVRFIWQPPVQRDPTMTLAGQIQLGPRCTADVSIRVTPTGEVIPPRGPNRAAGNLLTDDWGDIWRHDAFVRFRDRVERPTRCEECPGLTICAADCPREPAGWSLGVGGSDR